MKTLAALLFLLSVATAAAADVRRFTDEELVDGFVRTVFGAEYEAPADALLVVKRFVGPVRVRIEPLPSSTLSRPAALARAREAARMVREAARRVGGLNVTFVGAMARANLLLIITDRTHYQAVGDLVLRGRAGFMRNTTCAGVPAWRPDYSLERAVAIIPADIGTSAFRSCVFEEFLQLLGPVNDDATLGFSTFNDSNDLAGFPLFDQLILNLLYDRRIRPGMNEATVRSILPAVIRDVRPRVEAAAARRAGPRGRAGYAAGGFVLD